MTRDEFLTLLECRLAAAGVPVRRWSVEPGLVDLELGVGRRWRRVRTVRTAATR